MALRSALRSRLRHPGRWSIRARITATATVLVAVVLAVGAIALVALQWRSLRAGLDDALAVRADAVAAELGAGRLDGIGGNGSLGVGGGDDRLVQVVGPDGDVLAGLAAAAGDPVTTAPTGDGDVVATVDVLLPAEDETESFRVLSRRVDTAGGAVIVHVGETSEDIEGSIGALAASLLVAVPAAVAVLGVVVWWLVGRTLQPVEAIRAEVADIGGRDLHRRVPLPPTDDEVARLAATMNAMLDRLEEASIRQQQFVADASHELRSPLTRIRSEIEVRRAHGPADDGGDEEPILDRVLEETTELERLVADLLHLARRDAGLVSSDRQPVDLDDVAFREVRRLRAAGHEVDIEGLSAAHVVGDADQLRRVVRNLLDNAARHADSRITVTLGEADAEVRLVVADDGPGIDAADRERIFERFTRLDDARTRDGGGTGLGLAITRDIVEAHGGTVEVVDGDSHGATFSVRLPARS